MEMLGVFDFASPDMPTGKRYQTAVPQQALFLMNSPLVIDQAKNVVARPEFVKLAGDEGRIRFLYELLLQREPTAAEIELGRAFVGGARSQAAAGDLAGPPANVAGQVRRNRPNRDPAPITTIARPGEPGWAISNVASCSRNWRYWPCWRPRASRGATSPTSFCIAALKETS